MPIVLPTGTAGQTSRSQLFGRGTPRNLTPSWGVGRLAALSGGNPRRSGAKPLRRADLWEGSGTVKLVIGIVRPDKANDVLESLFRAEVRGLSISRVQGHGGELDRVETYRGTTVKMGLSEKVRFEIAVSDTFVQPTIDALCEGARTGEVGDGKIFVQPMERAVRIRTGETDHGAVTPVDS
jgi:nitrogen regulatory protein P-II 1